MAESLKTTGIAPEVYFDDARTARFEAMCKQPSDGVVHDALFHDENYGDPVGGEYAGRWLAAFRPVVVAGRPAEIGDTGWVVVVQERYEAALRPVRELGDRLMRYGLTALGVVLSVVTALWAFVIVVLNETTRIRIPSAVRRWAGLGTSGSGGSGATGGGSVVAGAVTSGSGSNLPTVTARHDAHHG